MKIIFQKHLSAKYKESIRALLIEADSEFVPPLSARTGTTQNHLFSTNATSNSIDTYFNALEQQLTILALEKGKVIGFMSLIPNHKADAIKETKQSNVYLSTIIVAKGYRKHGVADELYDYLLRKFNGCYIYTRTWSTNTAHLELLRKKGFYMTLCEENGRGEGIDTVYYCREAHKSKFKDTIEQYHLTGNILFLCMLSTFSVLFVFLWIYTKTGLIHELAIAFATSLIASVFCLFAETIIKYMESKNDDFIFSLKNYGIENLQFHKDAALKEIIPRCKEELWITGYRLIMTAKRPFLKAITDACRSRSGLNIRLLFVPMWSETYKKVYGDKDVTDCYIKVFQTLCKCMTDYNAHVEIRLTDKPIFNDTYKVDNRIITGPYLHCEQDGIEGSRITAKDFFSLDITNPNTELYHLMENDYISVWDSSSKILDMNKLARLMQSSKSKLDEMSAAERIAEFINCIK